MNKNGNFKSTVGFVLACVGSAVGMGNIWMFPYRLGQYGGAAFLIPYLIFIALFGFVGLSAEFALGRMAKTGTLGAYAYCWKNKFGKYIGWLPLLGSLGIAIGYSVILGWVFRSIQGVLTNELLTNDIPAFFTNMTQSFSNVPCHFLVLFVTCLLLFTSATNAIEKVNKVLMPAFFILFIILAIRVSLFNGAIEGYKFLFVPKWEYLLNKETWIMAMGQAFFSLSITGSGMIVYGAYLKDDVDIPKASMQTAIFDTIAAMLAALAIMPAVFSFGIDPVSGPSLMFLTLPEVFKQMPLGNFFALFFFISVSFAGITSLINMLEAVCESWQNRFHISRKKAVLLCGIITFIISVCIENGDIVGKWMDVVTIYIIPFAALLGAITIYYILGWNALKQELDKGRKKPVGPTFKFLGKYVYVFLAIIILILGILYNGIG
ncbi:sodium-dependent transporter [Holdemanella biformis]|jgi:neurotransmitter:Na+ symporter, NSS family|uniref:Sodium-dependent transporter n=1 Tax=Holdemanella biformis TaxID=1735 RepID=A0A395WAX5_9FIRM|nr:sodium-dependent transporter [Holdemanella biformis]MCC3353252.1 sodium-dependent transporter [Holdemanella biformis]RGU72266.1 sodium-dependent transporter [Holdemanella biformis]RGU92580.1 sodium-dependent transporter [Holdemanella biformis]